MKHAFLIMAHQYYEQVDKLIDVLDHERVDIFIHIDKKSPKHKFPSCKYSRLIRIPSIRTNWGSFSLVECELRLLEEALKTDNYCFIHLISGQDLPIKSIDYILTFFDSNNERNFIHYDIASMSEENEDRIKYYFPFLNFGPRRRSSFFYLAGTAAVIIQKILRVDRTKRYLGSYKSGSQWWSIKPDLARFVVSQRELISKLFKFTMCDEMFMQTLIYNSEFFDTVYLKEVDDMHANQRLIDFKRGAPHIWTMDDIEELKHSDLLFARKFDETVDSKVIDEVIRICKRADVL